MHETDLSTPVADADLDGILAEFRAPDQFPREAIEEVRRRREAMTPRLIEALRRGTETFRRGEPLNDSTPFFALFLLGEFRAKEALPAILDAISLPDEPLDELFGEAVTEVLDRVLAVLCEDRLEVLDELIENAALDKFVRWAAADALSLLALAGRIERQDAVDRLRGHLHRAVEHSDEPIATGLVCSLADLSAKEATQDVQQAFERGTVDEFAIDWEYWKEQVIEEERPSAVDQSKRLEIDTVEQLKNWCFRSDEPDDAAVDDEAPWEWGEEPGALRENWDWEGDETPLLERVRVAGRNDPCPCGSGKKFKKCCGAPGGA